MVRPNFYVRSLDATNANEIFNELYAETNKTNNSDLIPYSQEIIQVNHQTYAFFKQRYDLVAVRFEIADEVFYFGDDENNEVEYLTLDEINLIRDMGKITVDGQTYKIVDSRFGFIDTEIAAQRLFTFVLKESR